MPKTFYGSLVKYQREFDDFENMLLFGKKTIICFFEKNNSVDTVFCTTVQEFINWILHTIEQRKNRQDFLLFWI